MIQKSTKDAILKRKGSEKGSSLFLHLPRFILPAVTCNIFIADRGFVLIYINENKAILREMKHRANKV